MAAYAARQPPPTPPGSFCVLAFDFGEKRIGVAVGDAAIRIAHPLASISYHDNARRLQAIARLVGEWHPTHLILGRPRGADGGAHRLATRIQRFAQRLRTRFGLHVDFVDEHLSSWEATRKLSRSGLRAKAQKPHLDAVAACVILETWFEESRPSATTARAGC